MPSHTSEKIINAINKYIQARKDDTNDASLLSFIQENADLMREACNIVPNYQVFVRRCFQKQAKAHNVKMTNSGSIRWKKILFPEQDTTMSTIRTVSRSAITQTALINDISEWEVCISNSPLMFGEHDVEDLFNKYKQLSLEIIKNSNDPFGIQEIAAIDNILYLDILKQTSQVFKDVFPSSLAHDFRVSHQAVYKSLKKKFPEDIKAALEDILDDFAKEKNLFEAQKAINELLVDIEDEQVFQVVKMVFSLLDEVPEEEVVMSENHLTASFVHIIMKAIFKKDVYIMPHMSNNVCNDSNWRPDYKVSRIINKRAQQECFGEIKPSMCNDDSKKKKDLIKIMKYAKTAISQTKYNFFLTFVVQENMMRFFVTKYLSRTMYVCVEVESFRIPTTLNEIASITLVLTKLIRLGELYGSCKAASIEAEDERSLPESIIDSFFLINF
ncbi:hypothetical protein BD560DRAFT_401180 [Blakeslea trispora]|nr:hypothetical protein BD560DRAFT_401180 [Blakeslea trispora]